MAFTVYRLAFNDPLNFYEQLGDPITTQGGAPVPALRAALRHSVSLSTLQSVASEETTASRLRLRRQWRSLANNTPMKLTGIYLGWGADPEQNGWYMPDQGQMVDIEGASGLATGVFKVENFVWIVAGRPRTHRRAMWVYLKDLRTGLWARDYRRLVYSTDFSGLSNLALSYFGPGVSSLVSTASGAVASAFVLPAGSDATACYVAQGLTDLARVSFEQLEADVNKGQVVAYDRRGEQTGPALGPGENWEEFYGPDYPYSWMGPNAEALDTPVLENGRCRVRYDGTNTPGFRIDVWTGSKWEEQGKVIIFRSAPIGGYCNTLVSASLIEYSETRAVIQAVMSVSGDPTSREEVIITLQRGWSGPRFEVYPALNAAGEKTDALVIFAFATVDSDDSAAKIDAAGAGSIAATAIGTGHTGLWVEGTVGATTFTGENEVMVGRWASVSTVQPYGLMIAVLQAGLKARVEPSNAAYGGSNRNSVWVGSESEHLGYAAAQYGFPEQHNKQVLEAENMALGTGTTSTADAEASNGKAATATRTSDADHAVSVNWPNGDYGVYRVFARVKTSAATLKIYAKTSATTGATKETASTAYVWLDLGSVIANNSSLEIHAWVSSAATLSVDRVEAFLLEDRETAQGGIYQGGRDLGQAVLLDSRTIPTIVTRTV